MKSEEISDVVVVNTLYDIKKVIKEFMPDYKEDNPVVQATFKDSKGNDITVSAPTGCTYREMLLEGFNIVKKRLEAMNRFSEKANEVGVQPIQIEAHMWLDDLISRRLGGKRDGLRVKWQIQEGDFYFDPFTGKLTKNAT